MIRDGLVEIKQEILKQAQEARVAARFIAGVSTEVKNRALLNMADKLEQKIEDLLKANRMDLEGKRSKELSAAMRDRLALNPQRIKEIAAGLQEVALLSDPVGEIIKMWKRPNGLLIGKMRVPLGVIAIIYESRPNVTADAASLCLKAGNAVILRGGSEAFHSNRVIVSLLKESLKETELPEATIQFVDTTERQAVHELLKLNQYIDLVVPRGGTELIRLVAENSSIPVVKHDKGLCHIYVDNEANLDMAVEIVLNAKVQRPGVCNAAETLLVHQEIAQVFLPRVIQRLESKGVEIRGCPRTKAIYCQVKEATEDDWEREYLDLILSIKVVNDMEDAMEHIARYSSMLAEAIITNNYSRAMRFLRQVDSAAVFVNASTRFTDGNQFGLGAELGISTQKLHVRGPVGLEDLTSPKYVVLGDGQIRV
jgi:glutamate-5-semialdehyde dehydrogenase